MAGPSLPPPLVSESKNLLFFFFKKSKILNFLNFFNFQKKKKKNIKITNQRRGTDAQIHGRTYHIQIHHPLNSIKSLNLSLYRNKSVCCRSKNRFYRPISQSSGKTHSRFALNPKASPNNNRLLGG